jgi:hypothetical protein
LSLELFSSTEGGDESPEEWHERAATDFRGKLTY